MSESYSVKAILSAADKGFSSTFNNALSATNSLNDTLKSGLSFGIFSAIGQKAVGAVTESLSGMIGDLNESSAAWKTFQSTMRMNGHTKKEINSVKKELQDFAEKTIYSSSDMASTFAQLDAVGTKNTKDLVKGFGGLAAAAADPQQAMKTLSQQATQMAAKPKVAWEDFKLLVEQTPAGIAAVAKSMGMSTQEMIAAVQDGKIATEDFFEAITKTGTNAEFSKLATEYKTVDQAMDGLTETVSNKLAPAYDALSQIGIDAVSAIADKIGTLNGDSLAAIVNTNNLKMALSGIAAVIGGGFMAESFGAAVSSAGQYGLTLSNAFSTAKSAAGQVSDSVAGIGQKLRGLNVESVTKKLNNGLNKMNRGFRNAGKSLDGFGGDIAASLEAISPRLSETGLNIWGTFESLGNKVTSAGKGVTKGLKKNLKTTSTTLSSFLGGISEKASTVAKPFAAVASGIATGVQKSASVGMSALNGMASALVSVAGIAMKAVAPAAIFGILLAGLGLVNSQFGDQIDKLLQTAITKGPGIITGLVSGIAGKLPSLIASGAELVAGFADAITANIPAVLSGGVTLVQSLVQGVSGSIPTLLPAGIELVAALIRGILTALPQLLLTGMQLLLSLSQGVLDNAGLIVQSASGIVRGFVGAIVKNLPGIISTGTQILTNLAQGAIQILPQLLVVGVLAISTLVTGIASNLPQIMQSGVQMVQMLITGIVQNLPMILSAAITAIVSFVQAIAQSLPTIITSGAQIIASLVTGLIQMLPSIVTAGWDLIRTLGSAISEAIPDIITGAVQGIKDIFTGLWDFITGKNEEGASQTTATISSMAVDAKSNVDTMSTGISGSIAGMNGDVTSIVESLSANVQDSFSTMNTGSASEAVDLMDSVTSSLSGMNSLGSADMSGLASSIISEASSANSSASGEIGDMSDNISSTMDGITMTTDKAMEKLPKTVNKAMSSINKELKTGGNTAVTATKTMSTNMVNALRTGLSQAPSVAKSVVSQVVQVLRSGRSGAYSAGSYISQGFAQGMYSQLGSIRSAAAQMVAAADAAVRAKAKIASPSKLFAQSGRYIAEGLGRGIAEYTKKATAASQKLAQQTFSAFKKANGNYEKLAESQAKKYSSGMKSQKSTITAAVKDLINVNIKKLTKKNEAASSSYKEVGNKLYDQFKKQFDSQADKAISAVENKLETLGKKAQEKYDKIIEARNSFRNSLSDVDLYHKNNNGKIVFTDFKAEQKKVNQLSANLSKLKKLKMPAGMMDEIVGMDTANALEFTNSMLKANSKELKAYAKDYSSFQKATKAVSQKYYKQDLANVKKDFNSSVTKEMKNLNKQLNQIGVNAMKGLVKGMTSQKKNLDSAGKQLADRILSSFKKTLKINSPSRVFMQMGHYIGSGLINGLGDMVKDVQAATLDLVSIPVVQTPQLTFAYGGELSAEYDYYRNYEYTIEVPLSVDGKEFARATATYTQNELDRKQSRNDRKHGKL